MLQLLRLAVHGFRSFETKQSLDLDLPGLTFIAGRNELEPSLGANGAGKSTIFEALCWVLFGKTSRGLRAGDIAPWDGSGTVKVVLHFALGAGAYCVRRTWNPVALELRDDETGSEFAPISQEKLDELIGYSFETFLYAVLHPQFGEFFCDLAPARQLEVYTAVLRLDLWERASDEAAKLALAAERELGALEVEAAKLQGRLLERRRALDEEETRECDWWRERRQTLRDGWQHLREEKTAAQELVTKAAAVKLPDLDDQALRVVELNGTVHSKNAMIQQCGRERAALEAKQQLKAVSCPVCYQKVDRQLLRKHWQEETEALQQREAALTTELQKAQAALVTATKELEEARAQQLQQRNWEDEAAQRDKNAKRLRQELRQLAAKDCPFDSHSANADCTELAEQAAAASDSAERKRTTVSAHRYWVKAFREIRLALIKSSLLQFELSTNSALAALGLQDWTVEYAVEAETKSGKLKKGFSINVRSPHNRQPVPFAAWSGGEGQRLRLAITAGLSDLIQDFAGNACNLEIFDEPTAHLSEDGIGDLLAMLAERAELRQSAVWLADHHVLDYGGFARTITVCKTEEGSVLQ